MGKRVLSYCISCRTSTEPSIVSMKSGFSFTAGFSNLTKKVTSLGNQSESVDMQFVFESIKLHCCEHTNGLVLVSSCLGIVSPVYSQNIKYTWYRCGENKGEIELIEENTDCFWYVPTVEDIGHKIGVQCEYCGGKDLVKYKEVLQNAPYVYFPFT